MIASCPYFSTMPSNQSIASEDESAKIRLHIGEPFSFRNLLTLMTLVPPPETGRSVETNVTMQTWSTFTWNSKAASSLANVISLSPVFGEIDVDVLGPSFDVVSSMAPLPMTTIRKVNPDS